MSDIWSKRVRNGVESADGFGGRSVGVYFAKFETGCWKEGRVGGVNAVVAYGADDAGDCVFDGSGDIG